jgi:hypothetical protein
MSYQVARDGKTVGTFTEEGLIEAVEAGTVETTDDAWTDGMDEWVTVESLLEIEEIEEEEAPAPAPAKPLPVPLGKPTASGRAPTSHYYATEPTQAPVAPVQAAPVSHSAPMHLAQHQPPVMMKGGYDPAMGRYGTAGTAIASLVLGIMSLIGGGITGIPAIICGHKALDKIRRTNGAFSGKGIAIAGLTLGYLMLVVSMIWFIFFLRAKMKGQ